METPIDPYAGESPAECFAVFSEYFFERPFLVHRHYPRVYDQLRAFYRQDPLRRFAA
jgi:Mlc titration factor MtfA (ptsG expression regulator)